MDLSLTPVKRVLKKTNMRVSDEAVKEFATLLEEITSDIAAEAVAIAKSKRRKTVKLEDVREASRKLR